MNNTISDWAVCVEDTFDIKFVGKCNTGRVLYGFPDAGDLATFYDSAEEKWKRLMVLGVEKVCIGGPPHMGDNVGILLPERVPKGGCIIGMKKERVMKDE